MRKKTESQAPTGFIFDTNDFLFDEKVLVMSNEEIGVYLKLMVHAWQSNQTGFLNKDERVLSKLANCTPEEWDRVRKNVLACFLEQDEHIYHKKLVAQFKEFLAKRKSKAMAGSAGAKKRWGSDQETLPNKEAEPTKTVEKSDSRPIADLWQTYSRPIKNDSKSIADLWQTYSTAINRQYIYYNNILYIYNKYIAEKWQNYSRPIADPSPNGGDAIPKKLSNPKKSPSEVKELIEYYSEQFKTDTGQPMHIHWAKTTAQFKKLLQTYKPELIRELIDKFFKIKNDPFIDRSGKDFNIFFSQINKLLKKEGGENGGGNFHSRGYGSKNTPSGDGGGKPKDYGGGW